MYLVHFFYCLYKQLSQWKKVELFTQRIFYLSLVVILGLFLTLASGVTDQGFMFTSSSPVTTAIVICNLYSFNLCYFLLRERRFKYPAPLPQEAVKAEDLQDRSSAEILGNESMEKSQGQAPVEINETVELKPSVVKQESMRISGTGSRESHNLKRDSEEGQ